MVFHRAASAPPMRAGPSGAGTGICRRSRPVAALCGLHGRHGAPLLLTRTRSPRSPSATGSPRGSCYRVKKPGEPASTRHRAPATISLRGLPSTPPHPRPRAIAMNTVQPRGRSAGAVRRRSGCLGKFCSGGQDKSFSEAVRSRTSRGILMVSIPAPARTASNVLVNWPARSRTRNRKAAVPSSRSISRLRAC